MRPVHKKHIKTLITGFERELAEKLGQSTPLDYYLRNYLKQHKSIGQNDRLKISDAIYSQVRYKDLLELGRSSKEGWDKRISVLEDNQIPALQKNGSFSHWQRVSVPKFQYEKVVRNYGEDQAFQYLNTLNERAPLTIRVNPQKITRQRLMNKWKARIAPIFTATKFSALGVQFTEKLPGSIYDMDEFEKGMFEIQDEGSQLVGQNVPVKPGDLVLDFCGGSGGKTQTFGPFLKNRGQIFLHDVRKGTLDNAKKRITRAGLTNCQIHLGQSKMENMKKKFDVVVVDAPCTGVGTLRRNPDIKWKFNKDYLDFNVDRQRQIFSEAVQYQKPTGRIVYITCSILAEENMDQVQLFQKDYGLKIEGGQHFECMPIHKGHDGFFSAVMHYK